VTVALAIVVGTGVAWGKIRSFESGINHFSSVALGEGGADGAIDILLVGLDSRTDAHGNPLSAEELATLRAGDDESTNTDTIILVRIPNNGKSATAISIPRDSYVQTPGGNKMKINGVYGSAYSATGTGVYGAGSNGSTGVYAWSGSSGYGLNAYSFGGNAVLAQSDSANVNIAAVRAVDAKGYGLAGEGGNIGVYAHNLSGTPGRDAYLATASLAGDFYGGVWVHGTLTKSAGTFKIDHPLDPANRFLSHSFVESPDMKNLYDGVATLDAHGEAWIELPAYFEALNRDFRYQLTALDQPAPGLHVAQRIEANRFKLAGGASGQQVSWQVTGTRKDAYAEAHRTPIEEDKAPGERGRYIAPELFGQPDTSALAPDRFANDVPAVRAAASAEGVDLKPLARPATPVKRTPASAPSP